MLNVKSGSLHTYEIPETETDRPLKCSFPLATGTKCQFCSTTMRGLIGHKVRGFYDPVQRAVITNECRRCRSVFPTGLDAQHHACSSFLHGSCRTGGSNVHTAIRQPQLPVECPLCKKTGAANHESKSLFYSRDEPSLPKFSSVSDYYDHIIQCHLSLPAFPRERFAKVAQLCCNNIVPVARLYCCWIARRPVKHVSRRGPDEGETKTKWRGLCDPKSVIESQKWAEAWDLIWRSQMMAAESQSTADGMHGSERTRESQPVESLSHRLERIELLNDHRDELLSQCAQSRRFFESFLCWTWLVEGDVASFQPFAPARAQGKAYNEAARRQTKTSSGTAFHVSVRGVRQWLDDGSNSWINRTGRGRDDVVARVSQEARFGIGRGSFPRDVEHSRDPPERETSTHSGTIQDVRTRSCSPRGCREHHQTGTHSTQSSSTPQGHRAGREQRAENSESTRAAPQESGGQIRQGDEIDIYETDLAESLAIWGFGEEDEVFQ